MKIKDFEAFYFDRIHINCTSGREKLRRLLAVSEIESECRHLSFHRSSLKGVGFETRIDIVAPTMRCLAMLDEGEAALGDYIFTMVEIAHDAFMKDEHEAERQAEEIFKTVRKKYSYGRIFQGEELKTQQEILTDQARGLFARRTFYSDPMKNEGRKRTRWFTYVIYARYSKAASAPCVHEEWRFVRTKVIRDKTGIKTIADLLAFDFDGFFEKITDRYIVHEQLDWELICRAFHGYGARRQLTGRRQKYLLSIQAHLESWGVETVSDFWHFVEEKYGKIKRHRGPLDESQKWIIKTRNNFRRYVIVL